MRFQQNRLFSFYFLIATTCFLLSSCREKAALEPPIIVKYLALGDSYTIGQGVDTLDRWPNQLSAQLISNGIEVQKTDIIAQTGWRTSNLLNAIGNTPLDDYNLISLLIGVNNQFWGEPFDIFQSEFDSLLNITIDLVGKERLFIVSIPDYGVTPFGSNNSENIAEDIDMYNNYIQERCSSEGLAFINITEISRQLGDSEGALASDNLHPSGGQYAKWVEELFPIVLNLIAG
ncbi:SGNH/GDSL hydrolase family protein [Crocinitomicaceae bacterium]|nr:SGNH/GDSL hydrolase family protein [Crocinitomicaceae bacterium]